MGRTAIVSEYSRRVAHRRPDTKELDLLYGSWIEVRSQDQLEGLVYAPIAPVEAPQPHDAWLADLPSTQERYAKVVERRQQLEAQLGEIRRHGTVKGVRYIKAIRDQHMEALMREYRYVVALQSQMKATRKLLEQKINNAHGEALKHIRDRILFDEGADLTLLALVELEAAISFLIVAENVTITHDLQEAVSAARSIIRAYAVEHSLDNLMEEDEDGDLH